MSRLPRATPEEMQTRTSKRCSTCHIDKPLSAYHRTSQTGDGLKTGCKDCRNAYAKEKYGPEQRARAYERNRRRRVEFDRLKDSPCIDCNIKYPAPVMCFHHIKGPKLFNVGNSIGRPFEKIQEEVAKCILLCSNCHIMRHADTIGHTGSPLLGI